MRRYLAAVAAAALASGVIAISSSGASAAAAPPFRTYIDALSVNSTGVGADSGWYNRLWETYQVVEFPRLAFSDGSRTAYTDSNGRVRRSSSLRLFVGGHIYVKNNGAPKWTESTPTAAQIHMLSQSADLRNSLAKFYAIRGVHRVGLRQYRVSATDQQASAFLYWQYGATVNDLSQYDKIKAVTITLWTNASSYPLKFTVTGQSVIVRLAVSETFSYNRPVSIKAP